jgi:5-methylcytosine-specific restriction endonuclease McrA
VIERALETAGLMLGTDKSRGDCLEMICADFLAGVSLETGNQDAPLPAINSAGTRSSEAATRTTFRERSGNPLTAIRTGRPRLRLDPETYRQLCREVLERDRWRCQSCGRAEDLQVHHIRPRGRLGDDRASNLIALCALCYLKVHRLQQDTEQESRTH